MHTKNLVILCLLTYFIVISAIDDVPYGHLKPFGFHRPSDGNVEEIEGFPSPRDFYDKYQHMRKPVIFKNAAKELPAFKLWTDDYLRYADCIDKISVYLQVRTCSMIFQLDV